MTNCDIVILADLTDLVAFHEDNQYDLTLVASVKDYHIPYGVCELEKGGSLARIAEKPQYSFLVNTGMYIVRRDRLNIIPERSKYDMTDFIDPVKTSVDALVFSRSEKTHGSIQVNGLSTARRSTASVALVRAG